MDQIINVRAVTNTLTVVHYIRPAPQECFNEAGNPKRTWAKDNARSQEDKFHASLAAQLV